MSIGNDMTGGQYTPAEGRAREQIDSMLREVGWIVQGRDQINLFASQGVAVREFTLREGHGRVDYLLFIDAVPVGTIEAKPAGTTLTEVELQSLKYITGLPDQMQSRFERLPFAYESTGTETRFTNGLEPDPRSHTRAGSSLSTGRVVRDRARLRDVATTRHDRSRARAAARTTARHGAQRRSSRPPLGGVPTPLPPCSGARRRLGDRGPGRPAASRVRERGAPASRDRRAERSRGSG